MAVPLRIKGLMAVALPLIPLLAAMGVLMWLEARHEQIDDRLRRTVAMRTQAERVLQSALDAETGVRGYLLAENDVFLDPYQRARGELPRAVNELTGLSQTDDRVRIDRIRSLVERQLRILTSLVSGEAAQAGAADDEADEMQEELLLRQGKDIMDELRSVLAAQVADEEREFASASLESERTSRTFQRLVMAGAAAGVLGGLLAILMLLTGIVRGVNEASVNARRLAQRFPLFSTSVRGDEIGHLSRALQESDALLAEQQARRETAERDLRRSEERFRFLVESSSDVVARLTPDGVISYVSPAATNIIGYDPDELQGRQVFDLIHDEDRAQALEVIAQVLASGNPGVVAYRGRQKDGSYRWFEATGAAVDDPHGDRITEIQATVRDISERKAAEQAIHEANETLEHRVRERTSELEEARYEILQRLAFAAEYRDDDTHEHTQRVAETTALIAQAMELAPEEIELIKLAAPLHDIGKIGISDSILLKPGRFTEQEFATMKEHTTIGARILSGSRSSVLKAAELIALTHHERWDGSGYPRGLAGIDIPVHGRIVAVADVFDALTHDRPYKKAWPLEQAIEEVTTQAGKAFDPTVVEAFLKIVGLSDRLVASS